MTSTITSRLLTLIEDVCDCVPSFGTTLQEIRKAKYKTQQAISLRLNRGIAWVSEAENDHLPKSMSFADIEALASALECHPSEKGRLVDAFICHCLRRIGE